MIKTESLGKKGESEAVRFLTRSGYKIIALNYRARFGEIDIIARESGTICFIEVKTRTSLEHGLPCEAVATAKQRRMSKAALCFLKERGLLDAAARFDVVSVVEALPEPAISIIRNAFECSPEYTY